MPGFKQKLKKYFSGKLVIIQIAGGVGAFAGRTLGAYFTQDEATWMNVVASQIGSFSGYIGTYAVGYWFAFRRDYSVSGRSMRLDITRLQAIEQTPNIITVISSSLTQAALMDLGDRSAVLSANLASWFGPHKIINLMAMGSANSMKRAWVDKSWKPMEVLRRLAIRIRRPFTKRALVEEASATRSENAVPPEP
ncbi:MAG: hypothetical protein FJZ95_11135 [Chloroflexi bacterium]|nr:hypothetical protein [Chloroflexota bacterium]